MMALPDEQQLGIIKKNTEVLQKLNNEQIIMLALEALILDANNIPPGKRFPLISELARRSGVRS